MHAFIILITILTSSGMTTTSIPFNGQAIECVDSAEKDRDLYQNLGSTGIQAVGHCVATDKVGQDALDMMAGH